MSSPRAIPAAPRIIKPGFDGGVTDTQKLFVVAFDPGVKTGWFAARVGLNALASVGLRGLTLGHPDPDRFAWSAGYLQGPEPWQAELMMALVRGTWMHGEGVFDQGEDSDLFIVVLERFQLRMLGPDDTLLSPVRVSAMFRQLSWRAPFPTVMSSPSDAMNVFTDERLRAFNLWSGPAGKDGEHQRDAARHGALIIRKAASERGWLEAVEKRMPWMSSG